MRTLTHQQKEDIRVLMEHGTNVLGLRLCFHDRLNRSGLDSQWVQHWLPCCSIHKFARRDLCTPFDTQAVHQALASKPEGRIHRCPHGYTELAVPVYRDELFAGVLFAGPCWMGRGDTPHSGLVVPPNRTWLRSRLIVLRGLGTLLGELLIEEKPCTANRRNQVLKYLRDHVAEPIRLQNLAKALSLSPSRTGHVVREIFGMTFPRLLQNLRTQQGAELLIQSNLNVGEIASRVGFEDSNYFTYVFSRQFQLSPLAYRKRHANKV